MLTIPSYDGTRDLKPHRYKYSWYTDGSNTSDSVRCRCFPIFLEGIASMWFIRLPPRSISTFVQQAIKFLDQFGLHMVQPKDVMSLSGLFQGRNVFMKSFMNRFSTAVTEVIRTKIRFLWPWSTPSTPKLSLESGSK